MVSSPLLEPLRKVSYRFYANPSLVVRDVFLECLQKVWYEEILYKLKLDGIDGLRLCLTVLLKGIL